MKTTTVICTRCKGTKYMRGQEINRNESVPNYKKNTNGLCFACMGKGTLELLDNKIYIDIRENGNILKYDNQGKYLGVYESPETEYLNSRESLLEYMLEYEDDRDYDKEDLINIEKEYRRIANRSKNIHNIDQCEIDLCDLFNHESAATEFVNWKSNIKFLNKYLIEVDKTIRFVNNIKETKMNKELLDKIKVANEVLYDEISYNAFINKCIK